MPAASMKQLLESGVHFGHQTRRWNPKMKPFIFADRGGIHIIDLQQTTVLLDRAYDFVRNISGRGGSVLFVGTKKQCQDVIRDEATRVGMPYVSHRWLGGLLTNFATIEHRIRRMHELRKLTEEGQLALLPTKERMAMERELEKLEINLGGVSNMTRLPDAVFVADPKREAIATKEVNKLGLPLIGLVDTNCDPDEVDYLIPGNDDAIRSCSLIVKTLARAVEEGRQKVQVAEFLAADAAQAESKAKGDATSPASQTDATPSEARPVRAPRTQRSDSRGGQDRQGTTGRARDGGRSDGQKAAPARGASAERKPAAKKEAATEPSAPKAAKAAAPEAEAAEAPVTEVAATETSAVESTGSEATAAETKVPVEPTEGGEVAEAAPAVDAGETEVTADTAEVVEEDPAKTESDA